ncbi:hypothetical protein Y032_0126g1353 [Ancylostoma ceylanicum]|uniref:Reverse transcriptase domain-containing protein n=1 Tax=Ancylostoma ceylanicum TaxID=53326 RepID=A0A016T8K2_9BILA|nr:hypothetical protein Y032_0126g1353 [Ancylostoma ceylanicum]
MDTLYADEVLLATETKAELGEQPQALHGRLADFGPRLNVRKTEYLTKEKNEHGTVRVNVKEVDTPPFAQSIYFDVAVAGQLTPSF